MCLQMSHTVSEDSEMCEFVVVLARELPSCQGFVRKLKNLRNPKISEISKTQKLRILYFQGFSSFLEIFKS